MIQGSTALKLDRMVEISPDTLHRIVRQGAVSWGSLMKAGAEFGVADQAAERLADDVIQAVRNGGTPGAVIEPDAPAFATLGELIKRPELLESPECVIPRLAYRGRLVVLAGPDKSGKSTLLRHAVTRLTLKHHFLAEPTGGTRGTVIWLGLEEATGDAVREFSTLCAHGDRVQLVTHAPSNLFERTRTLLTDWPADLLVVDSLSEYARVTAGTVPDDGDSSGWADVLRPLVALAREYDVAVVVLHHVRRSDGQYRGSSEIPAAADAIVELSMPGKDEDPTIRRIRGRGRWAVESFSVALREGSYELASGGTLSLDVRVLLYIENNSGATKTSVRENVTGRATVIDAALEQLTGRGALKLHEGRYYAPGGRPSLEVL